MCGIALIISGIRIDLSNLISDYTSPSPQPPQQVLFSIDDIKAALHRRGPDSIGSKSVFLSLKELSSAGVEQDISLAEDGDSQCCNTLSDDLLSINHESCGVDSRFNHESHGEMHFIGATLQLRGINPIVQPLVDLSGNILVYNGEIFGGIYISSDSNDSEVLLKFLGRCCISHDHNANHHCCKEGEISIPDLLSRIKGPWAFIYWQNSTKTLWFGREAFGRRSLLVHWPTLQDSRLLLTSVSPPSSEWESAVADMEESKGIDKLNFWEELPCGIYSISMRSSSMDKCLVGELKNHKWSGSNLEELIQWERNSVQPKAGELCISHGNAISGSSHTVLTALREAVMRRTVLSTIYQAVSLGHRREGYAPIAVLFSGGLDSMILSALLDQCLDSKYEIDLLNVSFDGLCAPDRISARAGLKELEKVAPMRRWKLIEIDADLTKLTSEMKHVMSLISPARTYMDLNIGLALWLAAGGDGWTYEGSACCQPVKYKSEATILLVGSGADEQCAGYGRYKTKYRNGSWPALHEEMKLDMQRIWKRNLGRDDRCIGDNGKEARFPFLDEDVIRTLLDIPLWEIADLNQPSGIGDKKILRDVARLLGLSGAAVLPKRAIQFGSRIARESNRKNFGSNRAANLASAGSVEIHSPSSFS